MTAHESEKPHTESARWDDEIDLRQYVDVLVQWWREIALMTIAAAVAAGLALYGLGQLRTPFYLASADVVIARVVSTATFDDRFQTVSKESNAPSSELTRRGTLLGLANSSTIAQAVIADLGDRLTEGEQLPTSLLRSVDVDAVTSTDGRVPSDLIRISVTADDPDRAATIANAWSRHYVEQINDLLGQVPVEVIESVQAELVQADTVYQSAQNILEQFIAADRTNELSRQIDEQQARLNALQAGRERALTTIIDQDIQSRVGLFANLVGAQAGSTEAVLIEQVERRLTELSRLHATRDRTAHLADQARTLHMQIENAGDAATATNLLALQLLKAQIFASEAETAQSGTMQSEIRETETVQTDAKRTETERTDLQQRVAADPNQTGTTGKTRQTTLALPAGLQLSMQASDAAPQNAEAQLADVGATVMALEAYIERLDEQIDSASTQLLNGDGLDYLDEMNALLEPAAEPSGENADAPDGSLQQAIQQSYERLFEVSALTEASQTPASADVGDAQTAIIQQIDREIQNLEAKLEAERATEQQLAQQRDLAWKTYDTLSNKVIELTLERTAANSEVRLGSPAIAPIFPLPGPSLRLAVPVAAALGFLFGVFVAFVANYLGYKPFLSRRKVSPA